MRRLLVLRPEPSAGATAEAARARGLDPRCVPLFTIVPVEWKATEPGGFDGLLVTSANAIRNAGERLSSYRGLEVFAVGEASAEAAREAGFSIAATGNAGIDRLLSSIEPELKLLHLCGEDRRTPEGATQEITAVPVYRAEPIEQPELGDISGMVAMIHSPRAGRRFAELVAERKAIAVAAISTAAAEAVGGGWQTVKTAEESNDAALLALAARLCDMSEP